ncbi:hypothetical protein [Acetobacter sp. UBA5411]|nr:hypothetical protein [Acetobacter sp. UBA5411]
MTRRLGKLAPRHDPRTFRMSVPLARALPGVKIIRSSGSQKPISG